MSRRICWDSEQIARVFDVEASRLADQHPELFERVHYPINRILLKGGFCTPNHVSEGTLSSGELAQFIDENELLQILAATRESEGNFLVGLRGAPGSGKSHLVKWLEHRLRDDARFTCIAIPREISSLGAVLKRIAEGIGIRRDFREVRFNEIDRRVLNNHLVSDIELATVGTSAKLRLLPEWNQVFNARRDDILALIETATGTYLSARLSGYQGTDEIPVPELEQGTLQELVEWVTAGRIGADAEGMISTLQAEFSRAWLAFLGLADFDLTGFLAEADRRTREKQRRLLLLMEDITSFDALHRELFGFLFAAEGRITAVLGWTSGYERGQLSTYSFDRLALHLSLTEETDSGERTFAFQDPRDVVGLAERYLAAVRKEPCAECSQQAACRSHFGDGLYPFNRASLVRFYENLVEERNRPTSRQTPRHYLARVLRRLLDEAERTARFPRPDQIPYLKALVTPPALQYLERQHREYVETRKWYSEDGQGDGNLPPEAYELLGVERPPEEPKAPPAGPSGGQRPEIESEQRQQEHEEYHQRLRYLDGWEKGEPGLPEVDRWRQSVADLMRSAGLGLPIQAHRLVLGAEGAHAVYIDNAGLDRRIEHTIQVSSSWPHRKRLLAQLALNETRYQEKTALDRAQLFAYAKELYASAVAGAEAAKADTASLTLGFIFECLVLEAASRGVPVEGSLVPALPSLSGALDPHSQPRLDEATRLLRRLLDTHRETLRRAFDDLACRDRMLDLRRLARGWKAAQAALSPEAGQQRFDVRTNSAPNLREALNPLWPAVVAVRASGLAKEEGAVRQLASTFQSGREFSPDAERAMEQLRVSSNEVFQTTLTFQRFKPYDERRTGVARLNLVKVEDGGKLLREALADLEGADFYRRLSVICRLPFQSLAYGAELEQAARRVLSGIRGELHRPPGTGLDPRKVRDAVKRELNDLRRALGDSRFPETARPAKEGRAPESARSPSSPTAARQENELDPVTAEILNLVDEVRRFGAEGRDVDLVNQIREAAVALRDPARATVQWLPLLTLLGTDAGREQVASQVERIDTLAVQALESHWGRPLADSLRALTQELTGALPSCTALARQRQEELQRALREMKTLVEDLGDPAMQTAYLAAEQELERVFARLPTGAPEALSAVLRSVADRIDAAKRLVADLEPGLRELYERLMRDGQVPLADVSGTTLEDVLRSPLARGLVISVRDQHGE